LFAHNDQRLIFPNLYRWPHPESKALRTDFPFFNWSHGSPKDIITQVKNAEWPNFNLPLTWYGMKVTRLVSAPNKRIYLAAERTIEGLRGGQERVFDAVILAVGFGAESTVHGINSTRYWSVDDSQQDLSPNHKILDVLVSGTGDGAIMDMLKFSVKGFDMTKFYEPDAPSSMLDEEFMAKMAAIEAAAPSDRFEAAGYFAETYESVPVPKMLKTLLEKRAHVRVTVNIADGPFLNANALPFNRYLAHALNVFGLVEIVALGRLAKGKVLNSGKTKAYFETPRGTETRDFDRVIPRHGPVLLESELVSPSTLNLMRKMFEHGSDPTLIRAWPNDFYRPSAPTVAPVDFEKRKFAIYGLAPSSLLDIVNESPQSQASNATLTRRIGQ
jgi:hypothetical protein